MGNSIVKGFVLVVVDFSVIIFFYVSGGSLVGFRFLVGLLGGKVSTRVINSFSIGWSSSVRGSVIVSFRFVSISSVSDFRSVILLS